MFTGWAKGNWSGSAARGCAKPAGGHKRKTDRHMKTCPQKRSAASDFYWME